MAGNGGSSYRANGSFTKSGSNTFNAGANLSSSSKVSSSSNKASSFSVSLSSPTKGVHATYGGNSQKASPATGGGGTFLAGNKATAATTTPKASTPQTTAPKTNTSAGTTSTGKPKVNPSNYSNYDSNQTGYTTKATQTKNGTSIQSYNPVTGSNTTTLKNNKTGNVETTTRNADGTFTYAQTDGKTGVTTTRKYDQYGQLVSTTKTDANGHTGNAIQRQKQYEAEQAAKATPTGKPKVTPETYSNYDSNQTGYTNTVTKNADGTTTVSQYNPVTGKTTSTTSKKTGGSSNNSGGSSSGGGVTSLAAAIKDSAKKNEPTPSNTGTGTKINLNYEELEANKNQFYKLSQDIARAWKTIRNELIPEIEASWIGTDSKAYTDKAVALEPKVAAAVQSLELISETFDKAAKELQRTQAEVAKDVNSI